MKFLKSFSDLLFGKLYVLTFVSIMMFSIKMLDEHLLLDGFSQFQIFAGLFSIISVILILLVFRKSPLMDVSKSWKIFNFSCAAIIVLMGIFLLRDYKQRPLRHSEIGALKAPTIVNTDKSIILEFPSGSILHCDKSEVKFDSINPLKAYQSYKIDIFGKKSPSGICIKSDLMKDYAYPISDRR